MNELNNKSADENVMDIPVVPLIKEKPNSEQFEQDAVVINQENPNLNNSELQTNNIEDKPQSLTNENTILDAQTLGTLNNNNSKETSTISSPIIEPNVEANVIPETMDLNYGVIPPNSSEMVLKPNRSNKKNLKIIIGGLIGLLLIILLLLSFIGYKFYISIDPVKEVTSKIKELGKNLNESYQNTAQMQLLKKSDKLNFTQKTTATMNLEEKQFLLDLDCNIKLLKSDNKMSANVKADFNDDNLIDSNLTIFKNSLFINPITNSYNFRVDNDMSKIMINVGNKINDISNNQLIETYAKYLAEAIKHNVAKQDFKISVAKINEDEKKALTAKYSLVIDEKLIKEIMSEFMASLKKDDTLKDIIKDEDLTIDFKNSISEMKLNFYVGLEGTTKIELISKDRIISYLKINDEHKIIKLREKNKEVVSLNIYEKSQEIKSTLIINSEKTKITADIQFQKEGKFEVNIKGQEVTAVLKGQINEVNDDKSVSQTILAKLSIKDDKKANDMIIDISSKSILEVNDSIQVEIPKGSINLETKEGLDLFKKEISQIGLLKLLNQTTNDSEI